MVHLWTLVSALSAKSKASPGLRRLPHSLQKSLFFSSRQLLQHIENEMDGLRGTLKLGAGLKTGLPSSDTDLIHLHYQNVRNILEIHFQLPDADVLLQNNISETENLLRVLNHRSVFRFNRDEEMKRLVYRLASSVVETCGESLSTAHLMLITELLLRTSESLLGSGATPLSEAGEDSPLDTDVTASPSASPHDASTSTDSNAADASAVVADRWAEKLVLELCTMLQKRLEKSAEHGFQDDNYPYLCQHPLEPQNFHYMLCRSVAHTMSLVEFRYFFALTPRLLGLWRLLRVDKGKVGTVSGKESTTAAGEEGGRPSNVPHRTVSSISRVLSRLCLFERIDEIVEQRALSFAEIDFIIEVSFSPMKEWSVMGLKALNRFYAVRNRSPSWKTAQDMRYNVLDFLSPLHELDICKRTLRRFSNLCWQQLHHGTIHVLLFFIQPVGLASSPSRGEGRVAFGIEWAVCKSVHTFTIFQRRRLLQQLRVLLYSMREQVVSNHLLQTLLPPSLRQVYMDHGGADDAVVLMALSLLNDENHMSHASASLPSSSSHAVPVVAEVERKALRVEQARSYFSICQHLFQRRQRPWLAHHRNQPPMDREASASSLSSSMRAQELRYFGHFIRLLIVPSLLHVWEKKISEMKSSGEHVTLATIADTLASLLEQHMMRRHAQGYTPPLNSDVIEPALESVVAMLGFFSEIRKKSHSWALPEQLPASEPGFANCIALITSLGSQMEIALVHTLHHLLNQQRSEGTLVGLGVYLHVMTYFARNFVVFSSKKSIVADDREVGSVPVLSDRFTIELSGAELAATCLDIYLTSPDLEGSNTAAPNTSPTLLNPTTARLTSLATRSVVLLTALPLPASAAHLKKKLLEKKTFLRLFNDFGNTSFSIIDVFELLKLVFTRAVSFTSADTGGTASSIETSSGSSETTSVKCRFHDSPLAVAMKTGDFSVLESAVQATRRVTYHHHCFQTLRIRDQTELVENCYHLYQGVEKHFCALEIAQTVAIRALSACAYLALDHYRFSRSRLYRNEVELRTFGFFCQSMWKFYAIASANPAHHGPQVEKYMRMIHQFLLENVWRLPLMRRVEHFERATPNEESLQLVSRMNSTTGKTMRWNSAVEESCPSDARQGRFRPSSRGSSASPLSLGHNTTTSSASLEVQWEDLKRVHQLNQVFGQVISQATLIRNEAFDEDESVNHEALNNSVRAVQNRLMKALSPVDEAVILHNMSLRRALRLPTKVFSAAVASVGKDTMAARRAVLLSELYVNFLHHHAAYLLPTAWKEVCSQLRFFRSVYLWADSPGICVLDSWKGKRMISVMQQLLVEFLAFESSQLSPEERRTQAPNVEHLIGPGPQASAAGYVLELNSLGYLFSSMTTAMKKEALPHCGVPSSSALAPHRTLIRPEDTLLIASCLEEEIQVGAASLWPFMSERKYSQAVHTLHKSLQKIFE